MAIRTIQQLLDKFGPGDSPRSSDYIDLIETLADDRNAIYFSATAPEDTAANPVWFDTSTNTLNLYNNQWESVGGNGEQVDLSGYYTSMQTDTAISNAISGLVDSSPEALNTLNELAAAINDDANFATTITNSLSNKQDVVANVSSTEIGYLEGVTSAIQTQINNKAASSHTHAQSDITNLTTDLAAKANLSGPTFTGTVTLPSTTSIGNVSSTELGYLDGTTSAIQTQIDAKANKAASINTQTSSYVLSLSDAGAVVEINSSSPTTVTLPTNSISAIPIGSFVDIVNLNSGEITLTPGTGNLDWETQSLGHSTTTWDIKFAQDKWIAMAGSSTRYSADTYTWNAVSGNPGGALYVDFDGNKFIAVGNVGGSAASYQSTDGISWTSINVGLPSTRSITEIKYANNIWVTLNNGGASTWSEDGTTWTAGTGTIPSGISAHALGYGNGLWVMSANSNASTSSDGKAWTNLGTLLYGGANIHAVYYGNGLWVAVGANGNISTSTNGTSWTARTSGTTQNLINVYYANNIWYAVGISGTVLASANGITWSAVNANVGTAAMYSVHYANNLWLIGGTLGTLRRSGSVTANIFSKNSNLKLSSQYSSARVYKRATNDWVATGDLSA